MQPLQVQNEERVQALLQWEKHERQRRIGEICADFEKERRQMEGQHMQPAGILHKVKGAWQKRNRNIAEAFIAIRRQVALSEHALSTDAQMQEFLKALDVLWLNEERRREKLREFVGGKDISPTVFDASVQQWEREDRIFIADIRNRVEQLKIELQQGLYAVEENYVMRIEINNSTIHQLNLGQIRGDMNNAVTTLTENGHGDVASALKQFTEQVAAADDPAIDRKDVIEHLGYISKQAALPPAERSPGILKTTIAHVQDAVKVVGTLSQAWKTFGPIIEGFLQH